MHSDSNNQFNSIKSVSVLMLLCIVCIAPFLNKAFHIDDPTFIGMAKHIQAYPFDYFGYYMQFSPPVITNPPLVAYYIALAGFVSGYGEISLHTAFLLPACAVIAGTYLLARDLCPRPFTAAVAVLCTPVFMISSTTIMCDVLMLSFWVFSIFFWRRGILECRRSLLLLSSVLVMLCMLTKYMGACLIPLLLAYSLLEKRKPFEWILYLLLPIAAILLFDQITYLKYGLRQITFIESWSFYNQTTSYKNPAANAVTGLSFLGGCILVHFIYLTIYSRKFYLFIGAAIVSSVLLLLITFNVFDYYPIVNADGINWVFLVQLLFFVFAGACFIFIITSDLARNRNPDAILLFLWVIGVFTFTAFVNWSVNARSILPIAPVAGIMVMRFLKDSGKLSAVNKTGPYLPLVLSLLISVMLTYADYGLANSARTAAFEIHEKTKNWLGNVFFEGHWGFQHYFEGVGGGKLLDYEKPSLHAGDLVIVPNNNTNTKPIHKHLAMVESEFSFDILGPFTTMSLASGAGFYSDVCGPLPYAVGRQIEKYYLYKMIMDKHTRFSY